MVVHNGENIHSGEKQTLDSALQKIEEGSSAIQLLTRQYTRTISDLERQTTEKTQLVEELSKKLEKSEKRAKEAQRKAEELNNFKNTNYASLIQEIFEQPKKEFGHSMKEFEQSMQDQSNKSVKNVVKYAVISILIALFTATVSSISSTLYILKISHDSTENIKTTFQEFADERKVDDSREINDRLHRR